MCLPGQPIPVPTTAADAAAMARAALGWLAEADAGSLTTAEQADCLRALGQAASLHTAAQARVLGAFHARAGCQDEATGRPRRGCAGRPGSPAARPPGRSGGCAAWRPTPRCVMRCRFPGCHQPAAACQPHHIIPRSQGGPASLTNLLLLCAFHHLIGVHRWGWGIVLLPDGTITATSPDRTRTLHSHGPPARAAGPGGRQAHLTGPRRRTRRQRSAACAA
jgi:hypothetical protein